MNLEPIDTSTTAGKARVMQLAAEGRRLAFKNAYHHDWQQHAAPHHVAWNWGQASFAIIAEPVGPDEVFVAIGPGPALDGVRWYPSDAARLLPNGEGQVVRYIRADLAGEAS